MTVLADALQPFIVRELSAVAGRPDSTSFSDIIISSTAGYDLDFDGASQHILLDFRFSELIAAALAAECHRLACASFQTIVPVAQEVLDRDNVAWSMVKLYYAAFYAGHALSRIFGDACSYFGRQQIIRLKALADAWGKEPTFPIESGLYRCRVRNDATILDCVRARAGLGGPHESFWSTFNSSLQNISEGVLLGPLPAVEAQSASGQLDDMRTILAKSAASSWLSSFRNELQYRQGHGVWYPARINARDRQTISGWIANWNRDPMAIDLRSSRLGQLGGFVLGCTFVIALCHTMLERVAERSSAGNRSFVRLGPMAFLNQIQA